MARPILLDVDTGTDDALAILYAVRHPDLDVIGISCVAGNSSVEQVVTNTLKVLDAADAPYVPVARGAAHPMVEPPARGRIHGPDGLGGVLLPDPARSPSGLTAVEMLYRQITASPEAVTLVGLAPQTNLAMLLDDVSGGDRQPRSDRVHGRFGRRGQRHRGGGVQHLAGP